MVVGGLPGQGQGNVKGGNYIGGISECEIYREDFSGTHLAMVSSSFLGPPE